jgi:hypothetical protein
VSEPIAPSPFSPLRRLVIVYVVVFGLVVLFGSAVGNPSYGGAAYVVAAETALLGLVVLAIAVLLRLVVVDIRTAHRSRSWRSVVRVVLVLIALNPWVAYRVVSAIMDP